MKICGACERELPDNSYSEEQREMRQSIRRCNECDAAGNQLVLMKKGCTRSEGHDCPICQLPLPIDAKQSSFYHCCMKNVCNGCLVAAEERGMDDCPFCRTPIFEERQIIATIRKRVDAGDPLAIYLLGNQYEYGHCGLEKDMVRAVELYERAAELGAKDAHYNLGVLFNNGVGVEKDIAKVMRHWESAAMCGHVSARHYLGNKEHDAENYELAFQHWMIAATM